MNVYDYQATVTYRESRFRRWVEDKYRDTTPSRAMSRAQQAGMFYESMSYETNIFEPVPVCRGCGAVVHEFRYCECDQDHIGTS